MSTLALFLRCSPLLIFEIGSQAARGWNIPSRLGSVYSHRLSTRITSAHNHIHVVFVRWVLGSNSGLHICKASIF